MPLPRRRRAMTVSGTGGPASRTRSLEHWSRHYSAPDYNSLLKPNPNLGSLGFSLRDLSSNTKNRYYPPEVCKTVAIWNIPLADINRYDRVWNLPFDVNSLSKDIRPLNDFAADYTTPFHHESALAERLSATILQDLQRILRYLRDIAQGIANSGGSLYPSPAHRALISEHGSAAYSRQGYFADRCALAEPFTIDGSGKKLRPVAWLMGDVKKSSGWRSSWFHDEILAYGSTYWNESRKPLAQVQSYVLELGIHHHPDDSGELRIDGTRAPMKKTIRYGFIITDVEVVLIKRNLVEKNSIYISQAFPLRRASTLEVNDVPDGYISAMTALIYIHLLAGDPESHSNARPHGPPKLGKWQGPQTVLAPMQWL